ncbi:uncharacterized protein LOC124795740 [Schistocerca piceifrons]|uniref:uncharacterized protein LOC124795740 n=1 Tax=Schistocerca piceifrons TaxID=274613 RepID=UPI001F5EF672|nr:uncharacterized protein LOC124795740 [Schistocerca piceifrons]
MASTCKARESVHANAANFESVVAQWFEEDDSCEEGNIFEDASSEESANEPANVNIEADDSPSDNITSSESDNEEPPQKRELFLDEKANPTYKATMSVNRFQDIRRMIRFDDRRTREARSADDKLAAVRYVWELFLDKCRNRMIPNDSLTVDEQLVPFRGRCNFTQYMLSKPAMYGIKIFWLCDATSAYALDGIVYTGRKPHEPIQKNLGLNVVKDLAKSIERSSKNITVDNIFTRVQLAEEMLQKQITVAGTIKQNKPEIPNDMKPSASRAIHSSLFAFRGDIIMGSLPDMREHLLS